MWYVLDDAHRKGLYLVHHRGREAGIGEYRGKGRWFLPTMPHDVKAADLRVKFIYRKG